MSDDTEDWDDEEDQLFWEMCLRGLIDAPENVRKVAALCLTGSTIASNPRDAFKIVTETVDWMNTEEIFNG